jgi:hypothetical protein
MAAKGLRETSLAYPQRAGPASRFPDKGGETGFGADRPASIKHG